MIDIHCHVLFDADDGAVDIETSLEMCKIAAADGIESIIATPHYIIDEKNEEHVKQKVMKLNEKLLVESVRIKIYPGNEIFIDYNISSKLSAGECYSLNDSRYVLFEFPMLEIPKYSFDAIYELQLKGYVPIIAHPERNKAIQQSPELLYEFVASGCLAQMNSSSISGLGGEALSKLSHTLLYHNLVHFVASDAHSCGRRKPALSHSRRVVKDAFGTEKSNELYLTNPEKIIKNQEIYIVEPVPIKKKKSIWQMCGMRR